MAADPGRGTFGIVLGAAGNTTQNNGRFFIAFKPRDERSASAMPGHRPAAAAARESARRRAVPAAGAGHHRSAAARATLSTNTRCRMPDLNELNRGRRKIFAKLKTLPELADVATDQQTGGDTLHTARSTATPPRASAFNRS